MAPRRPDPTDNPAADGERAARYDNLQARVAAELRERRALTIKANIQMLDTAVKNLAYLVEEAATRSANESNQNGAVGTLMAAQPDLELAGVLVATIMALHRA